MLKKRLLSIFTAIVIFLLCVILPCYARAEQVIDKEFGYCLDIPEEFTVAEYTPDGMNYRFFHPNMQVNLILKLYANGEYENPKVALESTLKKLNATYDIDSFFWQNVESSISSFKANVASSQERSSGWAVSVNLEEKKSILVLICYCDEKREKSCMQFIVSTLNSLWVNEKTRTNCGIFMEYAFPRSKSKPVNLNILGKEIYTCIDNEDEQASQYVVDCEWDVLKLYMASKKWKEAWIRYYRMIFRDSYGRLDQVYKDIEKTVLPIAKKRNPKNFEYEMNVILLDWVQNFEYKRDTDSQSSDFSNLCAVIEGNGSDCDSRSMLMCVLLKKMGVDSVLFISKEYSHAVYGADFNMQGAKIKVGEKWYLLGETTVKNLEPGLISASQNDTDKWIGVEFD